jgi:hypothetical protein
MNSSHLMGVKVFGLRVKLLTSKPRVYRAFILFSSVLLPVTYTIANLLAFPA